MALYAFVAYSSQNPALLAAGAAGLTQRATVAVDDRHRAATALEKEQRAHILKVFEATGFQRTLTKEAMRPPTFTYSFKVPHCFGPSFGDLQLVVRRSWSASSRSARVSLSSPTCPGTTTSFHLLGELVDVRTCVSHCRPSYFQTFIGYFNLVNLDFLPWYNGPTRPSTNLPQCSRTAGRCRSSLSCISKFSFFTKVIAATCIPIGASLLRCATSAGLS